MKIRLSNLTLAAAALLISLPGCDGGVKAPGPVLPVPEPKQVEWQKMETYAFVCFGLNTFTDQEWGYGDVDPAVFNPTDLDCDQWARTFVDAGMTGVLFTAKHHDGFCLWPTRTTDYNVSRTPYKDGKGDIMRELADACRRHGLKLAVYLSPWDRHQASYATDEYVRMFHEQLRELLTDYGDVFEVWFDGANGGDGWYGGSRETRTIDRRTYYDFPTVHRVIDELQPQAIVFSDAGPGCRWVGNENGYAGATNWAFLREGVVYPGYPRYHELQYGHADGNQWVAAECDVSIRPGWYYHEREDSMVKSVDHLTDLYYRSVGHNATLLLNFPIDKTGRVNPTDSANAVDFHKRISRELGNNLLKGLTSEVSDERGGRFTAAKMTDDDYDTYWATPDGVNTATVTFRLPETTPVNRMMLQEYIPLGQRVREFKVEYLSDGQWLPVRSGEETTTIGYKRLLRFDTVKTDALRVSFTDSRGPLCINNIEAFYSGSDDSGRSIPAADKLNSLPFEIVNIAREEAAGCKDGDAKTTACIDGDEIIIDLGEVRTVSSLHYLPDQSEYAAGLIANYELSAGDTPDSIDRVVGRGEFSNIRNNPILQSIHFTPQEARYLRLKATRMVDDAEPRITVAELAVR